MHHAPLPMGIIIGHFRTMRWAIHYCNPRIGRAPAHVLGPARVSCTVYYIVHHTVLCWNGSRILNGQCSSLIGWLSTHQGSCVVQQGHMDVNCYSKSGLWAWYSQIRYITVTGLKIPSARRLVCSLFTHLRLLLSRGWHFCKDYLPVAKYAAFWKEKVSNKILLYSEHCLEY